MFQGSFRMWKEGNQVKATMTADTPKGPMNLDFSAPIPKRFAMSGDANVRAAAERGARANVLRQVEFVTGFFKPEALVGADCVGYARRIYRSMRSANPAARRAGFMRFRSLRNLASTRPGQWRPSYAQPPQPGMPEPMPVTPTAPVTAPAAIVPAATAPSGSAGNRIPSDDEDEQEQEDAPAQRAINVPPDQRRPNEAGPQRAINAPPDQRRYEGEEIPDEGDPVSQEELADARAEQADVMGRALDTLYVINRAVEQARGAKAAQAFCQNPSATVGFDWQKSLAQTVKTTKQHPALALGQKLFLALRSEKEEEREKAKDDLSSLQDLADEGNKNAKLALSSLEKLEQIDREKKREVTMGGPIVLVGECFWKELLNALDYLDQSSEPGFWNNMHDEMEALRSQRDQMGSFWGSIGKGLKAVGNAVASSGMLTPLVSMIPVVGPGVAAGMTLLQKARGADPGSVQKIQQVNQLAAAGVPDAIKAKENLVVAQTVINKAEASATAALKPKPKWKPAPGPQGAKKPVKARYGTHYESGLDAKEKAVEMLSEESVVGE